MFSLWNIVASSLKSLSKAGLHLSLLESDPFIHLSSFPDFSKLSIWVLPFPSPVHLKLGWKGSLGPPPLKQILQFWFYSISFEMYVWYCQSSWNMLPAWLPWQLAVFCFYFPPRLTLPPCPPKCKFPFLILPSGTNRRQCQSVLWPVLICPSGFTVLTLPPHAPETAGFCKKSILAQFCFLCISPEGPVYSLDFSSHLQVDIPTPQFSDQPSEVLMSPLNTKCTPHAQNGNWKLNICPLELSLLHDTTKSINLEVWVNLDPFPTCLQHPINCLFLLAAPSPWPPMWLPCALHISRCTEWSPHSGSALSSTWLLARQSNSAKPYSLTSPLNTLTCSLLLGKSDIWETFDDLIHE